MVLDKVEDNGHIELHNILPIKNIHTMKYKELINKLPTGWEQINLKTYQRVMNQSYDFALEEGDEDYPLQQIDNSLLTISALMEIPIDVLKGYEVTEYIELAKRIQFINVHPAPSKIKPNYIKDSIDITLDNYLTYQALAGTPSKAIENIKGVMELFVKDTVVEPTKWYKKSKVVAVPVVDSMNMIEVFTFFFFVQALLKKSLRRIQQKQTKQLMVVRMQQKLGLTPTLL
jgi:hypothetical protein